MNLMIRTNEPRPGLPLKSLATAADILTYAVADCELGKVLVARSDKGVCSILLGDSAEELEADFAARFPRSIRIAGEALVADDVEKVLRYVAKPSDGLHLTLDMRGTPFQRRVWEKMTAIPAGRTVSYRELAKWIAPLANPRAVAGACAANPIALAIPCHRVVRSNGDLAGYRWGIARKRALLSKEATA